jgi:hypothetical protein
MPKRKQARPADSDNEFIVTTEESASKDEYASSSEAVSEKSDSLPLEPPAAPRSSRRQSSRALASPVQRRKAAQLGALEKLKSARKALETRKKTAPAKMPSTNVPDFSDDSWSDKGKSPSPTPPPSARKRARARAHLGSTNNVKKPNQLLLGHRDYKELDGKDYGGSYTDDDDDLAAFIASDTGEEEEERSEHAISSSSEEEDVFEEEKKPVVKKKKAGTAEARGKKPSKTKKTAFITRKTAPRGKKIKRENKVQENQQYTSSDEGKNQGKEENAEDTERFLSSGERRRRLKLKPEVVIMSSSSSESEEEDSDAVLAATTNAAANITSTAAKNGTTAVLYTSSQSPNSRKRLRKIAEQEVEKEVLIPPPSPKTLLDIREKNLRAALDAATSLSDVDRRRLELAVTFFTNDSSNGATPVQKKRVKSTNTAPVTVDTMDPQDAEEKNIKKALRERPERPRLSAAQRIAQAQAAFTSKMQDPTRFDPGNNGDSATESDVNSEDNEYPLEATPALGDDIDKGDEEEKDGGGGGGSVEDSEGSLRDLIVHDGEEEQQQQQQLHVEGQGKTTRTPVWQEAVESLRIGQRDEEECFYDYIEYLLMCYVDPTYKARINESSEHKAHFQYSVRRIETKMTTARDAVHSEAWRSCSRGFLEAVEWLPGAQSQWDPDSVREDTQYDMMTNFTWEDTDEGFHTAKCAACNRRNSHATRKIIFKGTPRPPPEDETWEDVPANKKLSERYLSASPIYKKNRKRVTRGGGPVGASTAAAAAAATGGTRQGGGRRGFQLGFRGHEEEDDDDDDRYNSDDSLSQYIRSHRCSHLVEADLPFDPEQGPTGNNYITREFPVGRQCSVRLMLYHGMFHWKHRLLARLKFELKEERRRRRRSHRPIDPGSVSDGVLSNEPLKQALWRNFKKLTAMGEAHQLAGGEIGNSAWRGGLAAADPHKQVVAVLAALHDSSDGEESDVYWGVPGEEEEEEEGDDNEGASGRRDKKRQKIAEMYKQQRLPPTRAGESTPSPNNAATKKKSEGDARRRDGRAQKVDIRNFFGASPVKK